MSMESSLISDDPNLSFTPFAIRDIKETWAYLSEHGDEIAANFIRSILRICGTLSQNPDMGSSLSDLIVDLRLYPFKNYNIFYFRTKNGVEIYRVLHGSRDTIQIFDDKIDTH